MRNGGTTSQGAQQQRAVVSQVFLLFVPTVPAPPFGLQSYILHITLHGVPIHKKTLYEAHTLTKRRWHKMPPVFPPVPLQQSRQ